MIDKPESAPLLDAVFGGSRSRHVSWTVLAWIAAFGLHAALFFLAQLSGPSLETWSARISALVHRDLNANAPTAIEALAPPPPPPPAPPPIAEKPPSPPPPAAEPVRVRAPQPAAAPAQAAQVVAAAPDAPVDLTADTFITGTANAYAGGATTSTGTSDKPVSRETLEPPAPSAASTAAVQPVSLTSGQWQCPWPAAALAQDLYEQFVIVRAWVRADGSVERASVVSDPGFGFGAAAIACALHTRFNPARNARGEAVNALSPPIRVRFTR